jgi:hypothetical protein
MDTNKKIIEVTIETYDDDGNIVEKNNTFFPILPNSSNVIKHVIAIGKYHYLVDDEGEIKDNIKSKQFGLTTKQEEDINVWKERIKALFGEYGKFDYTFTPTELGDVLTVFSYTANIKKDFTDIESW